MEPPNSVKMDSFKRIQGGSLSIGPTNYLIFKGVNTIGRNKSAIVNIKHLNVSQNQATIVVLDSNQHFVSDLNSSNGTFINNTKLVPFKLYELTDKAEVKFGDVSAVYSKFSAGNITLNLQETLDTSEMTQNMTQNFYASNTQLIFNKHVSDHSYVNTENTNSNLYSLHEEATQVVDNPLRLAKTRNIDRKTNTIIEEGIDDIHDAPTQVVIMKEKISNPKQSKAQGSTQISENSDHSIYNKQLHEAPTQDIDLLETKDQKSNSESSSTQILGADDITEIINTKNSLDSSTQVLTSQQNEELIDRIKKINQLDDSTQHDKINTEVEVITESNEGNEKPLSPPPKETEEIGEFNKNKTPSQIQKKNVIHNSQTPSTSKCLPQSEYDESFLNVSKFSKVDDIEETVIENHDSNDSIDFFEIQNIQEHEISKVNSIQNLVETNENAQSSIIPKSPLTINDNDSTQETGFRKKLSKPIVSHDSDSETDIDTQKIGFRKRTTKPIVSQETDSETEIDDTHKTGLKTIHNKPLASQDSETDIDTQNIGFRKRTTRPIISQDSDSETEIDDPHKTGLKPIYNKPLASQDSETDMDTQKIGFRKRTPKPILSQESDSETDDKQLKGFRKRLNKPFASQDSDSDTGIDEIQNNKEKPKISNSDSETDCDEELLEKLNAERVSSNQICDFDNENINKLDDSDCVPATQDAFADALGYQALRSQNHSSEESFKLGLTELMDYSDNKDENIKETDKDEKTDSNNEKNDNLPNTNENINKKTIKNDDKDSMYLMPTQKIAENNTTKKFTFKKQSANLDESLNTILNSNNKDGPIKDNEAEDVFLQPTQRLDIENSEKEKTDEIFLQPTQKMFKNKPKENYTQSVDDANDIFMQATQKLNSEEFAIPASKDDVFLQPTQPLYFTEKFSKVQNTQDNDLYMASTQVLHEDKAEKTQENVLVQEDLYGQATQKLDTMTQKHDTQETQNQNVYDLATQQIYLQTDEIVNNSNIPDTDTQLEMPFTSQNTDFKISEESGRPGNPILRELDTLSHQEGEIISEATSSKEVLKDNIPEIAIFKEPLTIKDISTTKANDHETLSQIEAFIKKPLPLPATRKSVRKSNVTKKIDTPENLSQIKTFINKPLNIPTTNESKLVIKETEEEISETLSQIAAFVNKPLPKIEEPKEENQIEKSERNSRRISKRRAFNSILSTDDTINNKLEIIVENDDTLRDDEDSDKRDSSKELKSDVDQSFALLESKSSKIRRKPKNVSDDIKVSLTSHRRSMSTAENIKIKEPEIVIQIKQSNTKASTSKPHNLTNSDNFDLEVPNKASRGRSRKPLSSSDPEKRVSGREKKIEETKVNHTELKDSEENEVDLKVPTKRPATRKSRKPSTNSEPEKKVSVRGRNVEETKVISKENKDFESDEFDLQVPTKAPAARKLRKTSASSEIETRVSTRGKTVEEVLKTTRKRKTEVSELDQVKNEDVPKTPKRTSKRTIVDSSEDKRKVEESDTSNDLVEVPRADRLKAPVVESSENVGKRTAKMQATVSNGDSKNKRITKRHFSESSEDDFVKSEPSTPAKRGRMVTKLSNVSPDDTGSKSRETSVSNDSVTTPRKGRCAPKTEVLLASAERSKRKQRPKVVFTMLDSPQLESYIKHLGGSIVDSVDSCTVLVTQSIKRSQKLLTAVGQGKPICSPEWIRSSKKSNQFLDPWDFLLVDEEAEKKWDFSLKESLIRAGNKKLLENYVFQLMVTNALDVLKGSIEASGGKVVTKIPGNSEINKFIIIATSEQKSKFQRIKKQHPDVTVIEPEAIFDGILRQEFRIARHLLT